LQQRSYLWSSTNILGTDMSFKKTLLPILLLSFFSHGYAQEKSDRTQYFPKSEMLVNEIPKKENVWVFILAGQSNMAGRGLVAPQDTVPNTRILTINKQGDIIFAKEPLHFYEPSMAGLDCGLSFGKGLLKQIPDSISVLLIPTAVGGSSITQWLSDSTHREVKLLSNFSEKTALGMRYGEVKGILWHQGESDAKAKDAALYQSRLSELFHRFRNITGNKETSILIGQLGSYSTNALWPKINDHIKYYASTDPYTALINTADLKHNGDEVHFNAESQRILGERLASEFVKMHN